ncbi:class II D-tagatose-bisphosphate aldolase, non-catalytic subunit [Methylocapsa polymorpha]|uniref:Class II D-tagatose-bisphosphate aldolase, non-catalytic subunit n=1 Tax=Methylocapsa polymorpha TaxID=3080828 RepID=A0ABZ0HQF0_9HYPH|nr:class II D-tagatose-bisphosphate aldolase, non-catalytic subunit [Methylocapsa sp. RX1]
MKHTQASSRSWSGGVSAVVRTSDRIRKQARRWPCTLLGVGVVSKTAVDAAIDLANEYNVDIMLIPSRRQVDMDSLGGGYVHGWNAQRFADHVRARDRGGRILMCRDHGGPWQNTVEIAKSLSPAQAMESAKQSYREDIEAGFSVLHLDTSVTPEGEPSAEDALARLFELYRYCDQTSRELGRDIAFEVGTEEQDSLSHSMEAFFTTLERIVAFCNAEGLQKPTFVVAQTGTKVMEARNVGLLDNPYRIEGALPSEVFVPRLIKGLQRFDIFLKQHNTDYLSDEVLKWHPWLGIHSANVAPEYGVAETRALLRLLYGSRLDHHCERFLELAYNSRKWEKWMLPDTTASDRDRAIIAGHYVFSTDTFQELKSAIERDLRAHGVELDQYLREQVKVPLLRHLKAFRLSGMS